MEKLPSERTSKSVRNRRGAEKTVILPLGGGWHISSLPSAVSRKELILSGFKDINLKSVRTASRGHS